jgi:hypothetical protein
MGNKIANFEGERRGKQTGLILHGVIAPPTRRLLKERLMRSFRLLPSSRKEIWSIQNEEAVWTSAGTYSSMDGVKNRVRTDEDERSMDIWRNGTAEEPFR